MPPLIAPFIRRHLRLVILGTLLLALQGWTADTVLGHGIGYAQVLDAHPVVLEFQYAAGDPAAYAAIKVYAPDDQATPSDTPKAEYQNGRTDASGRFSFVPDAPGKWTVVMTDGQGHRGEAVIDYSPPLPEAAGTSEQMEQSALRAQTGTPSPGISPKPGAIPAKVANHTQNSLQGLPNTLKAVLGLSLLLNILTLYYVIKSKLEDKRRGHAHQ